MKRETTALLFAIIFVAIVVMHTNSSIGDYKLEAALATAKAVKIEHKARPIKNFPIDQQNQNSENLIPSNLVPAENLISQNFGENTKDINQNDVFVLQRFLNVEGYLETKYITGEFGPITKQAVRDFQKENQISPASGFVGDLTRSKINEMISLAGNY